jgi:phage shock protein PspC (stress-responsive transcriptional regulator)
VRRRIIGDADLLVLGGIACLFDWPVTVMAIVGIEVRRRWWIKQYTKPITALPGIGLGLIAYLFWVLVTNFSL